jgi:hypothetical protein
MELILPLGTAVTKIRVFREKKSDVIKKLPGQDNRAVLSARGENAFYCHQ